MENELKLIVDSEGRVIAAEINDEDVGEVIAVVQSFVRGTLQAQLTLNFTKVVVEEANNG